MKMNLLKISKSIIGGALASVLLLNSCSDDSSSTNNQPIDTELNTTFAVISDCHYFLSSLGTSGKAFENYIASDRKLIAESQAISESVFNSLKSESFKFLLISGDLTKDGEKASHLEFAKLLTQLEATGKKVYVVPGNHDVNNPHSMSFVGDNAVSTPSVSAAEFAQIYKEFGFGEAIAKDPNSLSYIVEPEAGLWLFAMDPCRYNENTTEPITGGKYSDNTLTWIKAQLAKAKELGKTVIGMQHHGLVEHFAGQKVNPISKDYVIDDWNNIATDFAGLGMQAVFTGHYHANDVTMFTSGANKIYDVETGSLVTSPCPYRLIKLDNNKMEITTKRVQQINYNTNGKTFQDYAYNFTYSGILDLAKYILVNQFGATAEQTAEAAPLVTASFMAHYQGDEQMPAEVSFAINQMMQSSNANIIFLANSIRSIYTDLNPQDNNVVLTLPKAGKK